MVGRLALGLGVVVVAGFAGLGVVLAPPTVLMAAYLSALAGVIGFAVVTGHDERSPATPPTVGAPLPEAAPGLESHRRRMRVGLLATAATAATTMTIAGMVAVLGGAATGPLLLLAAVCALPWAWSRWRPHADRFWTARVGVGTQCPVEPNLPTGDRPLVSVVESLSTPALCAEWERSYRVLRDAPDQAAHHHVTELRRRYLDELDRRDPDGVARWLGADSRPACTSPRRHLTGPHPTGPRPGPHPTTTPREGTMMPEQRREGDPATEQARDTDLEPAPEHGDREGLPAAEQARRPPPAPDPDE